MAEREAAGGGGRRRRRSWRWSAWRGAPKRRVGRRQGASCREGDVVEAVRVGRGSVGLHTRHCTRRHLRGGARGVRPGAEGLLHRAAPWQPRWRRRPEGAGRVRAAAAVAARPQLRVRIRRTARGRVPRLARLCHSTGGVWRYSPRILEEPAIPRIDGVGAYRYPSPGARTTPKLWLWSKGCWQCLHTDHGVTEEEPVDEQYREQVCEEQSREPEPEDPYREQDFPEGFEDCDERWAANQHPARTASGDEQRPGLLATRAMERPTCAASTHSFSITL
ncbi:hypothetical protein PVAP13_9NG511700 [Panicum virgatum]|uniref:Uncharacterized protein n=1 Tax=Panicum virgatum TaxID=38727 RepID=A0A8T0MSQ3_PANVG|nr:hypothetical protein PVAP13_9NG511700 [Panicum virgatum]